MIVAQRATRLASFALASRKRRKSATDRALAGSQQTLLRLVATGDPAAVRQCIVDYGPLVWTIARRFTASSAPSDAATETREAAREIFVELWKHAGRYDPSVASEPAFVTMIARRRMLERRSSTERRPEPERMPETLADGEPVGLEGCVEASIAAGVLATLDPNQRRVLSLAIGQGLTHAEIAEATAMPLAAVKSLVRRALVAVRKRLQAPQGGPPR